MTNQFHVNITTQDKVVYNADAVSLVAPGEMGYLGVLAHHAPLIASLVPGKITVRDAFGEAFSFKSTGSGFLEVSNNNAHLVLEV